MDSPQTEDLRSLADSARTVIRRLHQRTAAAPPGDPAELYHLLGALRLLIADLAGTVPMLQRALEHSLLDGQVVPATRRPVAEDVWTTVGAASRTLAEAERAAAALSRELGYAQLELRDLAAP